MNRLKSAVLTAVALVAAIGCGGGQNVGISRGDQLEVVHHLEREGWEAEYGEGNVTTETNQGFLELPVGTIVQVLVNPRPLAGIIEVIPIRLPATIPTWDEDGTVTGEQNVVLEDATEIRNQLIPDRYIKWNFRHYTISLPLSYFQNDTLKLVPPENRYE